MELHVPSLGCLIFALAAGAANAQPGEITADAVHKQSGEPFGGILVAVDAPEYHGRHPTDSNGVVRLIDVPVGTWDVEFRCPSANAVGREIETRPVTVAAGRIASVNIEVPEKFCYEPPYSEVRSELRGYLSFGFERSSFEPCDADELNLSRNTYSGTSSIWVSSLPLVSFEPKSGTLYYTEFSGTLKGPGRFGHLAFYDYEVVVEKIYEVFEVESRDCQGHLREKDNQGVEPTT